MDTRKYIINRMRFYRNKISYQYGYLTAEEIVYGLREVMNLAKECGYFDLYDLLLKKTDKLRELLLCRGTPAFSEFLNEL